MKQMSRGLFLLFVFASVTFLPGCPYKLEALSPKYWDDSMRETTQDVDDVVGARSYH